MKPDLMLHAAFAVGWGALVISLALRGRRLPAALALVAGFAWIVYAPPILEWIEHLGSDSFSEAQNFDLVEALDFFGSVGQILSGASWWKGGVKAAFGVIVAAALLAIGARLAGRRSFAGGRPAFALAWLLIAAPVAMQIYPAISEFRSNSEIYRGIRENFSDPDAVRLARGGSARALNVVVYIGESTSVLNMGLYGYPRPTTPELSALSAAGDDLLVFENVFSTHVHTAPSLLEALSVGVDPAEDFLPIDRRRRVSLIDLLNKASIPSTLISNQGSSGTWNNLASTVVFRNVAEKEFSFNSRWLGELEHRASRPLDDEFLVAALDRHGNLNRPGPGVVFLHSYAGHGPYRKHIAERFRAPVDDFLAGRPAISITGEGIVNPERVVSTIEGYDSTVRYIDNNVVSVLRRVEASRFPAVFIYFSDHGDAVYAGLRHDSARFLHEMARVPYLVYFNEAAAAAYPLVRRRFLSASKVRRIATLAQFPASLMALFGLEVEGGRYRGVGEDEPESLPPIVTRETGAGNSYVRLGPRSAKDAGLGDMEDATDPYTELFRESRLAASGGPRLCQYRSNSIGKALRGALAADCLWLEIDGDLGAAGTADPEGAAASGADLEAIAAIARGYGRSLWIAGRGLASAHGCRAFAAFLARAEVGKGVREAVGEGVDEGVDEAPGGSRAPWEALIMLPPDTRLDDPALAACLGSLRARGLDTAWQVPSDPALQCTREMAAGAGKTGACGTLEALLDEVAASGAFTDVAFDYAGARAVERAAAGTGLVPNAWNVTLGTLDPERLAGFRMVAVDARPDPNDR